MVKRLLHTCVLRLLWRVLTDIMVILELYNDTMRSKLPSVFIFPSTLIWLVGMGYSFKMLSLCTRLLFDKTPWSSTRVPHSGGPEMYVSGWEHLLGLFRYFPFSMEPESKSTTCNHGPNIARLDLKKYEDNSKKTYPNKLVSSIIFFMIIVLLLVSTCK